MTLPAMLEHIIGRDADGVELTPQRCSITSGALRRTIGVSGGTDNVSVIVPAAEWPQESLDRNGLFDIVAGDESNSIRLGGYRLMYETVAQLGIPVPAPDPEHPNEHHAVLIELHFSTYLDAMADGRGGLIRDKTRNVLDAKGRVDITHPDYKTNVELMEMALDAIGLGYPELPATLNDNTPAGPLDWGSAPALSEAVRLAAYCGHALVLSNDGLILKVVRLPLPGEEIDIAIGVITDALPFALSKGPTMKARKIVVTSGRTRSVIVTSLDGSYWEWVRLDTRTGTWMNGTQWATAYPGEITPDDIDELRKGPPTEKDDKQDWGAIFGALRLKSDFIEERKWFVDLPFDITMPDDRKIGGTAVVMYARVSMPMGKEQFVNVPLDGEDPLVRIDGASPVAGKGVITLPSGVMFARVPSDKDSCNYTSLEAIGDESISITVAHAAHTGDHSIDYFSVGFNAAMEGGEVTLTEMTPEELIEAIIDPQTLIIAKDDLVPVLVWPVDEEEPVEDNLDELKAIAKKVATIRAAGDYAETGIIRFRTLKDIEVGDYDGVISQVVWDIPNRTTSIVLNEQHVPDGLLDGLSADGGYSLAAGIARLTPAGASVALSDVKQMGAPTGGTGSSLSSADSLSRGREATKPNAPAPTAAATPAQRVEPGIGEFFAIITGNTADGTNKWKYSWNEADYLGAGVWEATTGGRTHASPGFGYAYNLREAANSGSGVQGNGINLATLPAGFTLQPIKTGYPIKIEIVLPNAGGGFDCLFDAYNGVDGSCPS